MPRWHIVILVIYQAMFSALVTCYLPTHFFLSGLNDNEGVFLTVLTVFGIILKRVSQWICTYSEEASHLNFAVEENCTYVYDVNFCFSVLYHFVGGKMKILWGTEKKGGGSETTNHSSHALRELS